MGNPYTDPYSGTPAMIGKPAFSQKARLELHTLTLTDTYLLGSSTGGKANLGLLPGQVCQRREEKRPRLPELGDDHLERRRKFEPLRIGLPCLHGRFRD